MEKFETFTGVVAPLDVANVDTDQIIPKQFLKLVDRAGFGQYAFYNWRFKPDGQPDEGFVLNQPRYQQARILLARDNFGCGSSREHAPWALAQYGQGLGVVIAPSFADIFTNNAFNNGMLLISLPAATIDELFERVRAHEGYALTVDLAAQRLSGPDGFACSFQVDPFRKERLLEGLDHIGLTLRHEAAIAAHEQGRQKPWQAAVAKS